MQTAARMFFASIVILLGGCVTTSDNPLSDPKDAKIDNDLAGLWKCIETNGHKEDSPTFAHFMAIKDTQMDIVIVSTGKESAETEIYHCFPSRIKQFSFLNVKEAKNSKGWMFFRYEIDKKSDLLRIWDLNDNAVKDAVKKGKLQGIAPKDAGASCHLTDSTENLARIFSESQEEFFNKNQILVFKRIQIEQDSK